MKSSVSFIGSGNLAWHLAPALDNAGYAVREVYSRNPGHAEALIERLYEASVKATLDFSTSNSTFFIIAVSDDAIDEIAREIILPEHGILIHTSGGKPLSKLGYAAAASTGVFYPLQTFSKSREVDFSDIPVFIESESAETEKALLAMARAISKQAFSIDSAVRKSIHVAAVFSANFTNHMLTIAKRIADEHQLNFEWFHPLIAETINKSLSIGPENAQTGPAVRGDFETLDQHLEYLRENPRLGELYRVISQHIIDTHPDNY